MEAVRPVLKAEDLSGFGASNTYLKRTFSLTRKPKRDHAGQLRTATRRPGLTEIPQPTLIHPSRRVKKAIFLILYTLGCLLLVAVLLEIGLRWVHFQRTSKHDTAIKGVLREFRDGAKAAKMPTPPELTRYVAAEKEIRDLYPSFLKDGIAFGNSPFIELIQPVTESIVRDKDGVLVNLPNHTYEVAFGRYKIGDSWDPILYKDNHPEKANSAETEAFVKKHLFKATSATHDADGHRITLPASNSQDIVIVMGDSVAYGAAVNDADTLASQLQVLHPEHKFVNAGVGGSGTPDNLQRLEIELKRYGSAVKSVIYLLCENDWNDDDTPDKLAEGLVKVLDAGGVKDRVFIFTQYIERAMPDLVRGTKETDYRRFMNDKARTFELLKEKSKDTPMALVDWTKILDDHRQQSGSVFSGLGLYVDHCHLSPEGLKMLARHTPVLGKLRQP